MNDLADVTRELLFEWNFAHPCGCNDGATCLGCRARKALAAHDTKQARAKRTPPRPAKSCRYGWMPDPSDPFKEVEHPGEKYVLGLMRFLQEQRLTPTQIAAKLTADGIRPREGIWRGPNIARVLRRQARENAV